MVSFLALYRGNSINTAQLISVSTDSGIVNLVAESLLCHEKGEQSGDPAMAALVQGRKGALERIREETGKQGQVAEGIQPDS